ncbi:unnamed protein product [Dicrocoelium dendriticum]|nr:unnamed protein product [Dicrocoelium dendriticum]
MLGYQECTERGPANGRMRYQNRQAYFGDPSSNGPLHHVVLWVEVKPKALDSLFAWTSVTPLICLVNDRFSMFVHGCKQRTPGHI